MNEIAYSRSANVYDSLADAYLANHQDRLALQYSGKCVTMLANNPPADAVRTGDIRTSAEEKVYKLKP